MQLLSFNDSINQLASLQEETHNLDCNVMLQPGLKHGSIDALSLRIRISQTDCPSFHKVTTTTVNMQPEQAVNLARKQKGCMHQHSQ